MNMRRYVAKDMREALRQIRDSQGPDAVILSTRKVTGGVEVVAAIDFDLQPSDLATAQSTPSQELAEIQHETSITSRAPDGDAGRQLAALAARQNVDEGFRESGSSEAMRAELKSLRHMLETQLATLAWNDLTRRAPIQAELLRELTQLGLAPELAAEILSEMPPRLDLSRAQSRARAMLTQRLHVTEDRWLTQGGIVALVGPTGVGKTSAIAKLAARWVIERGPRDIALVSTDGVRFGAQEHIHNLGRLLGVPAYSVDHPRELEMTLKELEGNRLVLVDTAGTSQRDPRLSSKLTAISGAHPRLETALVLSASAQAATVEETVEKFSAAPLSCCLVTKLDEAASLGGLLSALVRARLPIAYVSEGQRIPEDLSPARAHHLVVRAVTLAEKSGATADEDMLRRRFGGVAHALA